MRLRFWGVRGSVPWTIPAAMGHGCNTPCVEIVDDRSGETLVIDAGSGLVGLGPALGGAPRDLPILLTHYHWDHLQGLPFLAQLYAPEWHPRILGPALPAAGAGPLDTLFQSPFFPVPAERLPNRPRLETIGPGAARVGGFDISAIPLNHPGGALAYRIHGSSGDIVYATDHEFGDATRDEALAGFARGAAALILDAHFTPEEIPHHVGWGHSDWRQCAEFAAEVGAGGLWLFHHKPGRTDAALDDIRMEAQAVFPRTETAGEGKVIEV